MNTLNNLKTITKNGSISSSLHNPRFLTISSQSKNRSLLNQRIYRSLPRASAPSTRFPGRGHTRLSSGHHVARPRPPLCVAHGSPHQGKSADNRPPSWGARTTCTEARSIMPPTQPHPRLRPLRRWPASLRRSEKREVSNSGLREEGRTDIEVRIRKASEWSGDR
jgi:hypothetical protein